MWCKSELALQKLNDLTHDCYSGDKQRAVMCGPCFTCVRMDTRFDWHMAHA